jgi:uncharacterized membrane protein
MNNELPQAAEKIANDYVDRLSARLTGMPASDRRELLNEVRSHIHDSYMNESPGDEIERILATLRKLGDPEEVIASRMPRAVERLGRSRKAPLYILAGALITLFGVPLGLGAIALLIGFVAALFGLLIAYYGAGVSLVVGGFLTAVICSVAAFSPGLLDRINDVVGAEVVNLGPFQYDPQLGGILGLIVSLLLVGLGLLMLWSGKYIWRGFRFVVVLVTQNIIGAFRRLIQSRSSAAKP